MQKDLQANSTKTLNEDKFPIQHKFFQRTEKVGSNSLTYYMRIENSCTKTRKENR
jgi:hypothetical protein